MTPNNNEQFPPEGAGLIRRNWRVGLRLFFAIVWSADAYFKWLIVLNGQNLSDAIGAAADGQPALIRQWIQTWAGITSSMSNFTLIIAIWETVIAVFLFLGLMVPLLSAVGIAFNLIIWSTAEGFGGIFQPGAMDIGTGPLYAAIFAGLIVIQAGRQKGVDGILHMRMPRIPLW